MDYVHILGRKWTEQYLWESPLEAGGIFIRTICGGTEGKILATDVVVPGICVKRPAGLK
jgi:hypothetical protein